jgi:hypothetical protein
MKPCVWNTVMTLCAQSQCAGFTQQQQATGDTCCVQKRMQWFQFEAFTPERQWYRFHNYRCHRLYVRVESNFSAVYSPSLCRGFSVRAYCFTKWTIFCKAHRFFFPVPVCAITASGVPGGTLVSMNRFSTLCGWLVQRQGWKVKGEYDRVSRRDRLGLTPDLTTRDLWRSRRWARETGNFVYSSLWNFKSSFTWRKILRHRTFPLYFPSERKVCCGFLLHRASQ